MVETASPPLVFPSLAQQVLMWNRFISRSLSLAFRPGIMSPIKPPFTLQTANKKVKIAQDLWNTCDPVKVAAAYTADSTWRNRDEFFSGTKEIEAFLTRKWSKEHNYRLQKQLFCFKDDRIAVEFWYEYSNIPDSEDPNVKWFRTYGIEHWVFEEESGKMKSRQMSGNTFEIAESERWFRDTATINDVLIPRGHISAK